MNCLESQTSLPIRSQSKMFRSQMLSRDVIPVQGCALNDLSYAASCLSFAFFSLDPISYLSIPSQNSNFRNTRSILIGHSSNFRNNTSLIGHSSNFRNMYFFSGSHLSSPFGISLVYRVIRLRNFTRRMPA